MNLLPSPQKITKSKLGFSLIELSIVLIIIGLLVAGVTSGASLVWSAKNRAFINELTSYKQAIYTFRALNDRFPSDTNENGLFGECWDAPCNSDIFTTSTFSGYNSIAPNTSSAPFIDLYLSKIIDFEPSTTSNAVGKGYPYSKVFKSKAYYFVYIERFKSGTNNFGKNIKARTNWLQFINDSDQSEEKQFAKVFSYIDTKLDDGLALDGGNMRSSCCTETESSKAGAGGTCYMKSSIEYDSAIDNKYICDRMIYNI